jgi:translation initiation factor 2 alpha subunit (eIF-2alpha)
VVVREVGLERRIQLKCRGPEGVDAVRKALLAAQEVVASAGGEVYAESAPRYRIRVKARDFKQGEELLNRAVEESLKSIKANGGEGLVQPSS